MKLFQDISLKDRIFTSAKIFAMPPQMLEIRIPLEIFYNSGIINLSDQNVISALIQ